MSSCLEPSGIDPSAAWKLGTLRLENRILLAPLAGVSNSPFRRICKDMACALVHSEMVHTRGWVDGNRNTTDLIRFHDSERPFSMQIYGNDPAYLGKAAALAAKCADAIDINMGCPAPKVLRTGAGGALMKDPARAKQVVEAVMDNAGGLPVTVKMRTGWNDSHGDAYLSIARMAEECGCAAVTLHPRTVAQRFSGTADWSAITRLVNKMCIPVIGSGDLFTADDARRMMDETGCAAVMLARGVFGNPWLIRECLESQSQKSITDENEKRESPGRSQSPNPSKHDLKAIALRHAEMNVDFLGESRGIRDFRKHLLWYLKGRIPRSVKPEISRLSTLEEVQSFLELI